MREPEHHEHTAAELDELLEEGPKVSRDRAGAGGGDGDLAEEFDEVDSADRLARRRHRRLVRQRIVFAFVVVVVVLAGGVAALVATDRWPGSPEVTPTTAAASPSCGPVQLPPPAEVSVTVLNGTDRRGLAGAVAAEFGQRGFQVAGVGNAPVAPGPVPAVVQYGPGEIVAAQAVAARIEGAQLAGTADPGVVLELGDGYTQLLTEDALAVPAPVC